MRNHNNRTTSSSENEYSTDNDNANYINSNNISSTRNVKAKAINTDNSIELAVSNDSNSDITENHQSSNSSTATEDELPTGILDEYVYFCYKCNIEFNTPNLVYYCIYCNDGFISQLTDSNMTSEDDNDYTSGANDDVLLDHHQLERALHSSNTSNFDSAIRMYDNQFRNRRRSNNNRENRNITVSYVGDGSERRSQNQNQYLNISRLFSSINGEMQNPYFRVQNNITNNNNNANDQNNAFLSGLSNILHADVFNIDSLMNRIVENYGAAFNMTDRGTEPEAIQCIKSQILKDNNEHIGSKCSICFDTYIKKDNIKILKCKHTFHSDCIIPWLNMHDSCPVCRTKINTRGQ